MADGGGDGDGDDASAAHEDYSCKSPFERLVRDVESTLDGWLNEPVVDVRTHAFAEHGLHWRREAYGCELRVSSASASASTTSAASSASTMSLRKFLEEQTSLSNRVASVEFNANKRNMDAWDFETFFDVPSVLIVRPMSVTGQFVDEDEALTTRSAFTLALSSLGVVKGGMAVVTPRGYHERDFTGDVCDDVRGDAVLETEVTSYTRFSTREETTRRTFAGCVNAFAKLVRENRMKSSTEAIDAETKELDACLVSARITRALGSDVRSRDGSDDDSDIEDMRAPMTLTTSRRRNVQEDFANDDFGIRIDEWDDHTPWAQWVSMEDPWRTIELDALWLHERLDSIYSFGELDCDDAPRWVLRGELTQAMRDWGADDDEMISSETSSLSELIYTMVQNLEIVSVTSGTADVSAIVDVDYWHKNDMDVPPVPSESILRNVLLDIFAAATASSGERSAGGHASFGEPSKSAPLRTLLPRLALHACLFRNARAISYLWTSFVRELRQAYWESGRMIPAVAYDADLGVDHSSCILNQKLQLLHYCMTLKNAAADDENVVEETTREDAQSMRDWDLAGDGWEGMDDDLLPSVPRDVDRPMKPLERTTSASSAKSKLDEYLSAEEDMEVDVEGQGVQRTLDLRLITYPHNLMNEPITQSPPCMTEDMLMAHEASMQTFGDDDTSRGERQRMQSALLVSDMSAFKAANPDALLADFVRWHSPKDWIPSEDADDSAPKGRLSDRMSQEGNTWSKLWEDAPIIPVSKQKALFDPTVEGEKVLHYLETIPSSELFAQIVACAFSGALSLYASSKAVDLSPQTTTQSIESAISICSQVFTRQGTSPVRLDEYDFAVSALQFAERSVARATSLHRRLPDVPQDLLESLLREALVWEEIRSRNVDAAAHHVVAVPCETPEHRQALRPRLVDVSASHAQRAEYDIRAPIGSSIIANHRLCVQVSKDYTRHSTRISVNP